MYIVCNLSVTFAKVLVMGCIKIMDVRYSLNDQSIHSTKYRLCSIWHLTFELHSHLVGRI